MSNLTDFIKNLGKDKKVYFFLSRGMKGWEKEIKKVMEKVPNAALPSVICSFSSYGNVTGRKMTPQQRKSNYGVTQQSSYISIPKEFITDEQMSKFAEKYFGTIEQFERLNEVRKRVDIADYMLDEDTFYTIAFNTAKYKTPSDLTTHKKKIEKHLLDNGDKPHAVNTEGRLTIWHEFGHVYDNRKRVSSSQAWKDVHLKWRGDGAPTVCNNIREAFAEAFANVLGDNGSNVPPYVKKFIRSLK